MKIAVLQDDFPPYHEGGSGVIAYQLAKEFSRNGHEVLVITTVRDARHAGRESFEGMTVVRLFSNYHIRFRAYRSLYNPTVLGDIERLLRHFAPDIVHVHNVHHYLSYYALVLARRHARRVIMTAHDTMSFHYGKLPNLQEGQKTPLEAQIRGNSEWRQFIENKFRYNPFRKAIIRRLLQNNVDRIVAVSNALKRALVYNGIRNVEVIHNGIDVGAWEEPQDVEAFKTRHGIGDSAILFGGRLSVAKGAHKVIEALGIVQKQVPTVQLVIIGKKDANAEHMLEQAKRAGVEDRLIFTGWISGEELRRAYYAAALVAVPSIYLDPFPTINLEAFACRKPVIATCFGGSPEIVEDGVNGYTVNPLDAKTMASKIQELLTDEKKRSRFGGAGYERVLREFTLTHQAREYERLFFETL